MPKQTKQPNPDLVMDLEVFVDHYELAALWSSRDNADDQGGTPLGNSKYADRLTKQAKQRMRADCESFLIANRELLEELISAAGDCGYGDHPDCGTRDPVAAACAHDLWLTRNGHGVGFWDRDLPESLGDRLTEAAKKMGEADLYVSRGWIYHD